MATEPAVLLVPRRPIRGTRTGPRVGVKQWLIWVATRVNAPEWDEVVDHVYHGSHASAVAIYEALEGSGWAHTRTPRPVWDLTLVLAKDGHKVLVTVGSTVRVSAGPEPWFHIIPPSTPPPTSTEP